jgi:hypothetical protein
VKLSTLKAIVDERGKSLRSNRSMSLMGQTRSSGCFRYTRPLRGRKRNSKRAARSYLPLLEHGVSR